MLHRSSRRSTRTAGNQAEVEKSATGTTSLNHPDDFHAEDIPHNESPGNTKTVHSRSTRQKWTREEYREVMAACYTATLYPREKLSNDEAYDIWRSKNPETRSYIDKNKLANVRRDILGKKRLTEAELDDIKFQVSKAHELNVSESPPTELTVVAGNSDIKVSITSEPVHSKVCHDIDSP